MTLSRRSGFTPRCGSMFRPPSRDGPGSRRRDGQPPPSRPLRTDEATRRGLHARVQL